MNSNQIKLLLIISIFILPFVISFLLLDDYTEDKTWETTNYGELIKPILPITDIAINTLSGIDNTNSLNGKWSLLYYLREDCTSSCEESVYLLRQVNSALGKDMNRLQRILLMDDGVEIGEGIEKTYRYIKKRGIRPFDYHINLEIKNELTPETWLKKEI